MDVVYILGEGSRWQNNEIRFSLRSLQFCMNGYDRVFIVGYKPPFLKNVHWIPEVDISEYAAVNIMHKVRTACQTDEISENFIFFNDDYFLLKSQYARHIKNGYSRPIAETLANIKADTNFKPVVANTLNILERKGLSTLNYDIHTPCIYNKYSMLQVILEYDWTVPSAYMLKSLYMNTLRLQGPQMPDHRLEKNMSLERYQEMVEKWDQFTISCRVGSIETLHFFEWLYPAKSCYEI